MRNSRVERVVYNCEHCEERYAFSSHVKYLHTARLTGEFLGPLRVYVLYGSSNKPRSFVSIYTWNLQIPMSNRIVARFPFEDVSFAYRDSESYLERIGFYPCDVANGASRL